jgi:hypothetical protein
MRSDGLNSIPKGSTRIGSMRATFCMPDSIQKVAGVGPTPEPQQRRNTFLSDTSFAVGPATPPYIFGLI